MNKNNRIINRIKIYKNPYNEMTNVHSKILNEPDLEPEPKSESYSEPQDCNTYECTCWLDKQWKNCKIYGDLINCMVKYTKGEILNTPVSTKPFECLDPEFKNCLIKLNEYGCFTIDSQEFRDVIENNTRYKQREYLNFAYKLKPNQKLSSIMENFDCRGLYYMAHEYYKCDSPNCKTRCKEYYQTDNLEEINYDNDEIWITKHQKLKKNAKSRIYKKTVHVAMSEDIDYEYNIFSKYIPDFYDNLVIFVVWNNIWERVTNRYMIDKVIESLQ